jgi:hypothetical protein
VLDVIAAAPGILTLNSKTRGLEPVGFSEPMLQVITVDPEGCEQPCGRFDNRVTRGSRVKLITTLVAVAVPGFTTTTL